MQLRWLRHNEQVEIAAMVVMNVMAAMVGMVVGAGMKNETVIGIGRALRLVKGRCSMWLCLNLEMLKERNGAVETVEAGRFFFFERLFGNFARGWRNVDNLSYSSWPLIGWKTFPSLSRGLDFQRFCMLLMDRFWGRTSWYSVHLGGGNSKIFLVFSPLPTWEMIQFDLLYSI